MRWPAALLTIILLCICPGCGSKPSERPPETEKPVEDGKPAVDAPDVTAEIRKQLAAARKAKEDALAADDRLAQLQADKDIAEANARLAKAEAAEALRRAGDWERQSKDKDKEIAAERTRQQQVWLYWFSGVLGVLALVGVGLGIWVPLVRRYAWGFATACGAVAALAITVSALLPYLLWVGGVLALAGGVWVVAELRGSHHANTQVAKALEGVKDAIPDYKRHFRSYFDEATDARFNRVRAFAGLKPPSK